MFKKQQIFIICFILIFQSCSLVKIWKHRKHDIRKSYYDNGSLEYQSSYFNDKLDGPTYYYDINGTLLTYLNGSLHGISESYYITGEIKYSCLYSYGHKNGEERFYHQNGQLQSLSKYDYGKQIGELIRWNEKGELLY